MKFSEKFSSPREIWNDLTFLGKCFTPMIVPLYYISVLSVILFTLIAYPIALAIYQGGYKK